MPKDFSQTEPIKAPQNLPPSKPTFDELEDTLLDNEPTPPTAPEATSTAIVVDAETNAIVLSGVIGVTEHGIVYNQDLLTQDIWERFYTMLERVKSARSWMLADYFHIGKDRFEISYEKMGIDHNMTTKSVEVYASVGRNVPELIRVNSPSFAHARLISSLPVEYQEYWMERAISGSWSVSQLRVEMARAAGKKVKEKKSTRLTKHERAERNVRSALAAIPRSDRAVLLEAILNDLKQKG